MKNIQLFLLGFLFVLCPEYFSQDTVFVNGKPKVLKKGSGFGGFDAESPLKKDDYLLEFSYGYPFVPIREASFFGLDVFSQTANRRTIKNTNHLCFRASYQLNDVYDFGLELTYAAQTIEYVRKFYSQNNPMLPPTDTMYQATVSKLRFLAKFGYHFNISDRFDAFGSAGFGFKQFNYSTRDSTLTTGSVMNDILPVAVRISLGGRFFISKELAVHVEGGLGGPIMQVGLTYKMHSNYYNNK